uniref:Ribosomal protein L14 n=1 Tax=Tetrahymena rostrata TaxID=5909 RepID=A0A650DEB9_TETRO|nr:ribosomal protein L14 [Tetrahymena rostrata]QBI37909.1 ribosomal protein L14 [Tetrahymena rostrata]QBI37957.1 ribosomal protein L14 [Tetrahymena rostrata]QGS65288.1 ribosomal protein L14 [Tetrahymena rostrata]URP31145.1 ribosomal protein L14 [Tetrahymena rostrata]
MIQKETNLKPIDKCGVWSVRAFHLYGGSFRQHSSVSNFIKISVKKTRANNWIPKKTKLKAIIVTVKKEKLKIDGSYIKFRSNNVVLLKKRLTPKGKILIGPVSIALKRKRFLSSFCAFI